MFPVTPTKTYSLSVSYVEKTLIGDIKWVKFESILLRILVPMNLVRTGTHRILYSLNNFRRQVFRFCSRGLLEVQINKNHPPQGTALRGMIFTATLTLKQTLIYGIVVLWWLTLCIRSCHLNCCISHSFDKKGLIIGRLLSKI